MIDISEQILKVELNMKEVEDKMRKEKKLEQLD